MKKKNLLILAVFLFVPMMAYAQNGCVDSPESSTAVLGLVGCLGAVVSAVRGRR